MRTRLRVHRCVRSTLQRLIVAQPEASDGRRMYIKAEAIPPLNALEFVPPAGVPHSWLHGATGFGPIWGSCTEAGGYCTVLPSTITVSAGELLRRTVTFTCLFLGGDSSETTEPEPPGEGYPPRDEPSSSDTDSDLPWDEPSWDELPWDESGDDHDDDDDLDDDMLERLCPQGGIRLRWSATLSATHTLDEHDGFCATSEVDQLTCRRR